MSRLAEAEKKLGEALAALESALLAIPTASEMAASEMAASKMAASEKDGSAPAKSDVDMAAVIAELETIDAKIEQAMTIVSAAASPPDASPAPIVPPSQAGGPE